MDRIIRYHLEPINISFHTTNPELRCKMLHNRFAGEALKKIDRLYEGGITMNGQIVLCKGVNDGEELERSIRDHDEVSSVSSERVGCTGWAYEIQRRTVSAGIIHEGRCERSAVHYP